MIINSIRVKISGEVPGEQQWIQNFNFSSQDYWFVEYEGDNTDVNGVISGEQANFEIIGAYLTFSNVSGIPDNVSWTPGKESEISITPDIYYIDQFGCFATHEYMESGGNNLYGVPANQSRNNPIIHWNRNITMPIDMSDYTITSAQLSAMFNGSADLNIETPYEVIEGWNNTPATGYAAEYDHARFYVQVSDLNKLEVYELAYNQTVELGRGYHGRTGRNGTLTASIVNDTLMEVIEEDELIFYLSRVLSHNNKNFTLTLGIDIYNEDNYASADLDTWYDLYIKSCNLSFDYQKNIDRFSSISWKQNCEKISSLSAYPVLVQNAFLNFNYKIDELWNTSLSPNSEIRILINDNKHTETVNLSTATTSFQEAKIGGFDVSNLITEDVNLSLQVYLADDFILDNNITISIDDVSLNISYVILEPDQLPQKGEDLTWLVYTLAAVIGGIVIIFGMYQAHFKYPPIVRKIRKLKKKVKKAKKIKPILLRNREELVKSNLQYNLESLEYNQLQVKQMGEIGKNLKLKSEGDSIE
jgi:hypothetical protein